MQVKTGKKINPVNIKDWWEEQGINISEILQKGFTY